MDEVERDAFRLVEEALERYRQQRADARALLESGSTLGRTRDGTANT